MRKEMNNAFEKKTRIRFLAKWKNTNNVSQSVHGHLITVTSHEHHGVINPRDSDCLFNSSFMLTTKGIELQSASLTLYEEKLPMIDGFSWQRVGNTENMPTIGYALMLSTVLVKKKTLWTSTPMIVQTMIVPKWKWLPNNSGTFCEVNAIFPIPCIFIWTGIFIYTKTIIQHPIDFLCITNPLSREAVELIASLNCSSVMQFLSFLLVLNRWTSEPLEATDVI